MRGFLDIGQSSGIVARGYAHVMGGSASKSLPAAVLPTSKTTTTGVQHGSSSQIDTGLSSYGELPPPPTYATTRDLDNLDNLSDRKEGALDECTRAPTFEPVVVVRLTTIVRPHGLNGRMLSLSWRWKMAVMDVAPS
ncbi:hypothetical protein VC83_09201 [Pseudogymnoascus destructans]|uniref:Uncharacterized protein n=1 Tax=Pseudogymnoascus destructans TaxID=655981 RepID=A0A176ZX39_9PEZI|nr:uncharacterized protein VC83_09201 [Pseudogymnoascus destructans]OAF54555.1 hypothetical protein VC83_09201 [Pseudogymnoascus destructans]